MWSPLQLERLTLATRLSPDECRHRLTSTTSHFIMLLSPRILPVRGFVRKRRFYLGQGESARALLRTWIYGQIRKTEHDTVIDIAIGPNRVAGVFLTVLATLLGTAAVLATFLAWSSPYGTWSAAAISWVILAAFIAVFFVFPAGDHPRERAFLLAHVEKTLEAAPIPALISPRKSSG